MLVTPTLISLHPLCNSIRIAFPNIFLSLTNFHCSSMNIVCTRTPYYITENFTFCIQTLTLIQPMCLHCILYLQTFELLQLLWLTGCFVPAILLLFLLLEHFSLTLTQLGTTYSASFLFQWGVCLVLTPGENQWLKNHFFFHSQLPYHGSRVSL